MKGSMLHRCGFHPPSGASCFSGLSTGSPERGPETAPAPPPSGRGRSETAETHVRVVAGGPAVILTRTPDTLDPQHDPCQLRRAPASAALLDSRALDPPGAHRPAGGRAAVESSRGRCR